MNIIRSVESFYVGTELGRFDLFVAALGYESRCTFAASKIGQNAETKLALGFDYLHCNSLSDNITWFKDRGFFDRWSEQSSAFFSDIEFASFLGSLVNEVLETGGDRPVKICFDISGFSSIRIANTIAAISNARAHHDVEVYFVYSFGEGYDKDREPHQIEIAGPVCPRYAGWTSEPDIPVHAIFGLGLEYEKAIGAFELLNPSDAFAFATMGTSETLDEHITEANRLIFPLIDESKRFAFSIERPMDLYHRLRSLLVGILRDGRPVIVPMGPKLFTLASLLIAEELFPKISVWRVSTGRTGNPVDIEATGEISGFSVRFIGSSPDDQQKIGGH